MPNYAMITSAGLNEINSAASEGVFISIQYYVPIYDWRLDQSLGLVNADYSASNDVSLYTSASDLYPQGEILWNCSGTYAISNSEDYIVNTGNESISTSGIGYELTNYVHENGLKINTYNTSAVGSYFTANDVLSPGSLGASWYLSDDYYATSGLTSAAFGPQSLVNPDENYLYRGVSYQQVVTSGDSRANFKVVVRTDNNNQIKFNKLALFTVKYTGDMIVTGEPTLFAQVIIPETQILNSSVASSTNFSVGEFVLDFQIDCQAVSANFEDIFFSSSADYWQRVSNEDGQYGLLYDGSVYVSNRLGLDDRSAILSADSPGVAKMLVSTFERVNKVNQSEESDLDQLCLQYVNTDESRIRTLMRTNADGDFAFDMYGQCSNLNPYNVFSVIPKYDKDFGLGTYNSSASNRWNHLILSDKLEMFDDSIDDILTSENFDGFYIKINAGDNKAGFYNSDVMCGPYYSSAMITTDGDNKYLTSIPNTKYFYGNISSYRTSASDGVGTATHQSDLLIRSLNDIHLITLNDEYADVDWATSEEIINRIWNLTEQDDTDISDYLGVDKDILFVAGRNIHTYGNVLPLKHNRDDIGALYRGYKKLWVEHIGYSKSSSTERSNALTCDTSFIPNTATLNLGSITSKWRTLYLTNLGADGGFFVDKGYLNNLYANNIYLPALGKISISNGVIIDGGDIEGTINNIGSQISPVNTIYANNIFLTNTGGEYLGQDFSITIEGNDFYDNANVIVPYVSVGENFILNFVNVILRYNSISGQGVITCDLKEDLNKLIVTLDSRKPSAIPYDLFYFSIDKFKGISGPLKFESVSYNYVTENCTLVNHGTNVKGIFTYDTTYNRFNLKGDAGVNFDVIYQKPSGFAVSKKASFTFNVSKQGLDSKDLESLGYTERT
jgi:hypothetical protein